MSSSSSNSSSSNSGFQHEDCGKNTIPAEWIEITTNFVRSQNESPTGIWADFNCVYIAYTMLVELAQRGLICESDLPNKPNPNDYTNLSAPASLNCPKWCWTFFDRNQNCPDYLSPEGIKFPN